jgi:hypothetical protein
VYDLGGGTFDAAAAAAAAVVLGPPELRALVGLR